MNAQAIESDVLLARGGDEAAFTRLVAACSGTVCSIALAIVRDVGASEDVAQETFVAAWRGLENLRNPDSFVPWLKQVARNQAHLWRREHAREISDEAILEAATDVRPSAEENLVRDEEQRVIRQVLDELHDDEREVLVLYYREGSSTAQVARLLEISEQAVRQRVARARARLRADVLERFGKAAVRTAPGAAFGAVVAAALTMSAPTATAAVASSKAVTAALGAKGALSGAALAGSLFGVAGVIMGMHHLEPLFDDEEARELRVFRNLVLTAMVAGCAALAVALTYFSKPIQLVVLIGLYAAIVLLYAVRLPRILERRMAWERSLDPQLARQTKRQWMWATISRAAAATLGGAAAMAILLK